MKRGPVRVLRSDRAAGDALAQAFAIAAGGWLLQGGGNMDQLERELGLRAVLLLRHFRLCR